MKTQSIFIFLIVLFILSACEQKHVYNKYESVDTKAWKATDTLSFPINIDTENKSYQYAISVRYSNDYEFSNIWLKVSIKGNQIDTSFRYEIPLFKNDGKPYGENSGSLFTQTIPLKTNLPLYQKGDYTFTVVQLMRKDPLNGISDIGIIVDKK
ncbi:MAG TPA: gliding motility lipoprotein GldH [Chitinophagales bacterium]|nr:gliding motility lipoprotein GldH [Chitinophagales bacterium]HNA38641.1 gliding motility lipoprotein GldH [Chitinophagales bacterium]HNI32000.1 gliding motility lipoprotein GldH [Chitinophagales bacterium]HNK73388.1 gliding motility lipoprotein GldH [Chitinophagales bacterium]